MIFIFIILVVLPIAVAVFINTPKFGGRMADQRREKIENSPNYQNGAFQNLSPTPALTEGVKMHNILLKTLKKTEDAKPVTPFRTVKTDLKELDPKENILVWFGHSSYFMQIDGKRILVDPVLGSSASPFSFMIRPFEGTSLYRAEDLPAIDYLLITHDHWDHLDYKTLQSLAARIGRVICGLGVGAHLERWGYAPEVITEGDWYDEIQLAETLRLTLYPSRHFSGRSFRRNNTLWTSFLLRSSTLTLYLGGDSGYDTHFKEIGEAAGKIDLAILENGQYDANWKYIHMIPEEVVRAARDLKTVKLFPVHSGKFALANHAWNEPLLRLDQLAKQESFQLCTPLIGEKMLLEEAGHTFSKWWKE